MPYDFLVTTELGFWFFVDAKAFSSFHLGLSDIEAVGEIRWNIDPDWSSCSQDGQGSAALRALLPVPATQLHCGVLST